MTRAALTALTFNQVSAFLLFFFALGVLDILLLTLFLITDTSLVVVGWLSYSSLGNNAGAVGIIGRRVLFVTPVDHAW